MRHISSVFIILTIFITSSPCDVLFWLFHMNHRSFQCTNLLLSSVITFSWCSFMIFALLTETFLLPFYMHQILSYLHVLLGGLCTILREYFSSFSLIYSCLKSFLITFSSCWYAYLYFRQYSSVLFLFMHLSCVICPLTSSLHNQVYLLFLLSLFYYTHAIACFECPFQCS